MTMRRHLIGVVSLVAMAACLAGSPAAGQTVPADRFRLNTGPIYIYSGSNSPEGVVTASPGAFYARCDTGSPCTNPALYQKLSGVGNTGWVKVLDPAAPPVTGSGTNNYLAGWTATHTLASSGIAYALGLVSIVGSEGDDAAVHLWADDGDDYADRWRLLSVAATNAIAMQSYTSGTWASKFHVLPTGDAWVSNSFAVLASPAAATIHAATASASSRVKVSNSSSGAAATDGVDLQMETLNAYLWNYESGSLYLGTGNATKVTIPTSGSMSVALAGIIVGANAPTYGATLTGTDTTATFSQTPSTGVTGSYALSAGATNGTATITASGVPADTTLAVVGGGPASGTVSTQGKLSVTATASPQIRALYDGSHYVSFDVSSGGDLTVTPTGGNTSLIGLARVQAASGEEATLQLYADAGEDDIDKWQWVAPDAGGSVRLQNYGSGSWVNALLIGTDGSVAATSFTGGGAGLTSIPETAITDGTIFPRLAANEIITGQYNFYDTTYMRGDTYDDYAAYSYVTGDAASRWGLRTDGRMFWGDGAGAFDVNLYRPSANVLETDDTFVAASLTSGSLTIPTSLAQYSMVYASTANALASTGTGLVWDGAGTLTVSGIEGGHAYLGLYADEGDDSADKWRVVAQTDGYWTVQSYASGAWVTKLSLDYDGALGIYGAVSFGGDLIPAVTDTYTLGDYSHLWQSSWISTMNALTFNEATQTVTGGHFTVAKQTGTLAAAVADSDATIDFGEAMTVGDFVLIRAHDTAGVVKAEYIEVGSVVAGTTYNVTRDLAGVHGTDPAWAAGVPWMANGDGDGRIDMIAADGSPRIVWVEQGATYDAETPFGVAGNLNGYYGYASPIWGAAWGSASAANMTMDGTNGFRVRTGTTARISLAANGSGSLADGNIAWDTSGNLSVAGWAVTATAMTSVAGDVGLSSAVTGGDDIRFFAGDATQANAEFRVYESGDAYVSTLRTAKGAILLSDGALLNGGSGGTYVAAHAWGFDVTGTAGLYAGEYSYGGGTTYTDQLVLLENSFSGPDTLTKTQLRAYNSTGSAEAVILLTATAAGAKTVGITGATTITGTANVTSTLNSTGNFSVATNKFTVTAATGNVGVGATGTAAVNVNITGSGTTSGGTYQYGLLVDSTQSGSTQSNGIYVGGTAAASSAVAERAGLRVDNMSLGSGASITTQYGVYIGPQSTASTNWNLYSYGSAATGRNYLGGDTVLGGSSKLIFDGSSAGDTFIHEYSANVLDVNVGGNATLRVTADNVLLSGASPTGIGLYTAGTGSNTGTALVRNSNGYIYLDSSSRRFKENIRPYDPGDVALLLRPVRFDYVKGAKGVVGFVAEDVAQVAPWAVNYDDMGQPESLRTTALLAALTSALRSQQRQIDELRAEVAELRKGKR